MRSWQNNSDNGSKRNIRQEKNVLREELLVKRRGIPQERKAEMDSAICKRLMTLMCVRYADDVLSFSPLKYEVGVTDFNKYLLEQGKNLYLPACLAGNGQMEFRLVRKGEELEKGKFSIMEPSKNAPVFHEQGQSVCIIPAVSFDSEGYRLGYGKGYYDRFLSGTNTVRVGVVYTEMMSSTRLPRGRYDVAVDIIVTEKSVLTVNNVRK